jgi:hypothetical protein
LEHRWTPNLFRNVERMAAQENDPEIKAQFENQAMAYRKLAADRAARYGLPAPSPTQELNRQ